MKRRLLKLLLITIVVVAFTGYFAFSTFFFSPTEADYRADVSTLIPRDVDFYLSKADLDEDLDPFPIPAFVDELEATRGGKAFFASPEWQGWRADLGLAELQGEIERSLEQLPIELEPLDVLGGRDIAVAGYFHGSEIQFFDWAVYARGNWMAKLGLAALLRPGWFDLASQGLMVTADEDRASITLPDLDRTLHVTRVRDVFIVATDPAMLQAAFDLAAVKGEDSFGGSARYYDHIQQRERDGDEAEAFVDYRALSEAMQYTGRWPDQASQDFFPAFMGRLFQSGALRELAGVVRFATGVTLEAHGELSSELVSSYQKQLYRQRGFERNRVFEVASFAPSDTALFAYFHAPFGSTLRQVLESTEIAARDNLDDVVREVWGHPDSRPLIDEIDRTFHDRAALILRANDYEDAAGGPPNDGQEVFAWAFVLWSEGKDRIAEIRKKIVDNQGYFGIQGATPAEPGVFTNETPGGQEIYEYWSPFIPGTGHFASVMDSDQGELFFILSNEHRMLGQILKTKIEGGARHPRLSENPRFEALVSSGMPGASLMVYANPKVAGKTLREIADRAAEAEADMAIDWKFMREKIDRDVLNQNFPDWNYETLSEEEFQQLELLAKPARDQYAADVRESAVPQLRAGYERSILYAEEVSGALLEIDFDPKKVDVFVRLLMDLKP